MDIHSMTKEEVLTYLERRAEANEKLIDVLNDTEDMMFLAFKEREIFMQEKAFQKVCELFSLQTYTYIRDYENAIYKYETNAEMEILGKRYKLFCIYNSEEKE